MQTYFTQNLLQGRSWGYSNVNPVSLGSLFRSVIWDRERRGQPQLLLAMCILPDWLSWEETSVLVGCV